MQLADYNDYLRLTYEELHQSDIFDYVDSCAHSEELSKSSLEKLEHMEQQLREVKKDWEWNEEDEF